MSNIYTTIARNEIRRNSPFRFAYVLPVEKNKNGELQYPPSGTLNLFLEETGDFLYEVPYTVSSPSEVNTVYPPAGTRCLLAVIGTAPYVIGFVNKKALDSKVSRGNIRNSYVNTVGNVSVSQSDSMFSVVSLKEEDLSLVKSSFTLTGSEAELEGGELRHVFGKSSSVFSEEAHVAEKAAFLIKELSIEVNSLKAKVQELEYKLGKLTVEAEGQIYVKSKSNILIDAPMVKIENASLINIGGPSNQPAVLGTNLVRILTTKILPQIAGGISATSSIAPGNTVVAANIQAASAELSTILSKKVNVAE